MPIHCTDMVTTSATSTLYVEDASIQTLASHPSAAVTDGVLGTQNTLSTTTGTLLLDQFVCDDLQIYRFKRRFVENVLVTKDQHLFVGKRLPDRVDRRTRNLAAQRLQPVGRRTLLESFLQ